MSSPHNESVKPDNHEPLPDPELERLKRDINRSDKEKFLLFAQMLRRGVMLKQAKITHKQ